MATVSKGRQFVSGETVTPAKLNELVDNATVTAIQTADISDSQITTAKIADGAVTNAKIASGVDASKLTTGTLPADRIGSSAITTARINDAAVTPAKLSQPYTLETAKASTSGTSVDFAGIPSWVKRVTVMFDGVSTNGTSAPIIQIGDSGGIESTGYVGCGGNHGSGSPVVSGYTNGFAIVASGQWSASILANGSAVISKLTGNTWAWSATMSQGSASGMLYGGGSKTLSDTLTQVRITTVNGTDTFDAGTINISYEG